MSNCAFRFMESSDVTCGYVSRSKRKNWEKNNSDAKILVPNFQLKFSIIRQIPATRSTSAREFLVGLGAYNGCYLRLLLEITSQEGNSRHNAVKSTETY